MRRFDATANVSDTLKSRVTNRATVDYDTYVLRYGAAQRFNVLLMFSGITAVVGSIVYLPVPGAVIGLTIGLGLTAGGAAGWLAAGQAHSEYREMAVSMTETYEHPRAAVVDHGVRPFVASSNGGGRSTVKTGQLRFEPRIWQELFDRALHNGGVIDTGVAKRSGVGARWYHTDYDNRQDGYQALLTELRNLRFIDDRNRLTDIALRWYETTIDLPLSKIQNTAGIHTYYAENGGAADPGWGE